MGRRTGADWPARLWNSIGTFVCASRTGKGEGVAAQGSPEGTSAPGGLMLSVLELSSRKNHRED